MKKHDEIDSKIYEHFPPQSVWGSWENERNVDIVLNEVHNLLFLIFEYRLQFSIYQQQPNLF